ncbi:hypothetical protein B0H19DRAFT_577573 [Mycena capillaripes]|nr:hypothetical protein B0H19DRAFT_577573 [Mycena capillaripes]
MKAPAYDCPSYVAYASRLPTAPAAPVDLSPRAPTYPLHTACPACCDVTADALYRCIAPGHSTPCQPTPSPHLAPLAAHTRSMRRWRSCSAHSTPLVRYRCRGLTHRICVPRCSGVGQFEEAWGRGAYYLFRSLHHLSPPPQLFLYP